METALIFIIISIIAILLLVFLVLFLYGDRNHKPLSIIATIALGFVLAGIIFSENRDLGLVLMSTGIILSIIDIIAIKRNNQKKINHSTK